MILFLPPILLIAWLEASWSQWLVVWGAGLPLTLLVLMYLRYRQWLNTAQTMLLAGLAGYWLDELASPRPGLVLVSMLGGLALFCWLLPKSRKLWQRALSLAAGLATFEIIMIAGFSWSAGYFVIINLLWFIILGLIIFAAMRLLSRQIEGWL